MCKELTISFITVHTVLHQYHGSLVLWLAQIYNTHNEMNKQVNEHHLIDITNNNCQDYILARLYHCKNSINGKIARKKEFCACSVISVQRILKTKLLSY